ncbi:hypothetical protein [Pseudomonas fontis]|uniref:Uncharacterized protein n=1 Tax=Pseudomonas fontis TaxID=2942633 RepID=A0ABT5NV03_9PSED|nr:hypothetical protein [Pseudomonas fontis]MDD0973885.1 hypothetical protein [Pseudomonas fontis]MDD0992003.1 hypothetical protein [Pseudomonas fontis]
MSKAALPGIFPDRAATIRGLLLFIGAIAVGVGLQRFHLAIGYWSIVPLCWWAVLGNGLLRAIWDRSSLRLPGTQRALSQGILLHLLLSIGVPLLALSLTRPDGATALTQVGALWLGSTFGLLFFSSPILFSLVPSTVLALSIKAGHIANPAYCALLGGLALLGTAGLWYRHLKHPLAPQGLPLGVYLSISKTDSYPRLEKLLDSCAPDWLTRSFQAPARSSQDRVASVLGPLHQTFRQQMGRTGQYLTYLVVAGLFGAALWEQLHTPNTPSLLNYPVASLALVVLALAPPVLVARLHTTARSTLAELLLTPGMPQRSQMAHSIMHLYLVATTERLVLSSLLLLNWITSSRDLGPELIVAILGFYGLLLAVGAWLVWRAWHGRHSRWLHGACCLGLFAFGLGGCILLLN